MYAEHSADWTAIGVAVRLVVTDGDSLPKACAVLRGELRRIDAACSRFRPDSALSRLNDGDSTAVTPALAEAIAVALRAARLSAGMVDPTVGQAMLDLGYDRDFAALPTPVPATATHHRVPGWQHVGLDPESGRVRLPAGVRLDLGATAKALAADRAARRIAAEQGCGVLVSLGGDISVAGRPPEGGWTVRVQDTTGPHDEPADGPTCLVSLRSGGLATSSTESRRWVQGGEQRHHIVDPLTGVPADSPWRTVSVAAGSCVDANIAATAAIVCGWPAPDWLATRGLTARLVGIDGTVRSVGRWPSPVPA